MSSLPHASGMRVKFWGVRGSIPTPGPTTLEYGGNTSCIEIRAGEQIVILDGGTGLRLLGRSLLTEFGERPLDLTLLLTHTHWDHIQGLPFFMPVYRPENRLRILGFEGARHGLENVLTGQMESPFFPIGLRDVPANVQIEELTKMSFPLGNIEVQACRAQHPGMCVGYRLSSAGGSVAFFPDNELRQTSRGSFGQPSRTATTAEYADSTKSGLREFLRETDVLIMDTQYTQEEYALHRGWGHGCVDDVVALALESEVKKLFLFHHDPDHSDAMITEMVEHARSLVPPGKHLDVDAAREGLVFEVGG